MVMILKTFTSGVRGWLQRKSNLKARGTFIDTNFSDTSNRICVTCGKVYNPQKVAEGIPVPLILLLNWCSRKCFDKP